MEPWIKVIHGSPHSKANNRRLISIGGKPRFIKSKPALAYEKAFALQCPTLDPPFTEDIHIDLDLYYENRRPDLDESLVLDGLQGRVMVNDRQVRSKTVRWHLDAENPRAEIAIRLLDPANAQQHNPTL